MRAIGFQRRMVQLSFLLESSFIALTSIVVGTALGLAVAFNVISDSKEQPSWENMSFDVPWLNLGVIFLAVYLTALVTTFGPASCVACLSGGSSQVPVRVAPATTRAQSRERLPQDLDRRFEAIVFDWDGTAVPDRQADATKLRAVVEELCGSGLDLAS